MKKILGDAQIASPINAYCLARLEFDLNLEKRKKEFRDTRNTMKKNLARLGISLKAVDRWRVIYEKSRFSKDGLIVDETASFKNDGVKAEEAFELLVSGFADESHANYRKKVYIKNRNQIVVYLHDYFKHRSCIASMKEQHKIEMSYINNNLSLSASLGVAKYCYRRFKSDLCVLKANNNTSSLDVYDELYQSLRDGLLAEASSLKLSKHNT